LGGAAGRFELDQSGRAQPHVPPDDPFAWPPGTESTLDSIGAPSGGGDPGGAGSARAPGLHPLQPPARPPPPSPTTATADPSTTSDDGRPRATIALELHDTEAKRGTVVRIKGLVSAD